MKSNEWMWTNKHGKTMLIKMVAKLVLQTMHDNVGDVLRVLFFLIFNTSFLSLCIEKHRSLVCCWWGMFVLLCCSIDWLTLELPGEVDCPETPRLVLCKAVHKCPIHAPLTTYWQCSTISSASFQLWKSFSKPAMCLCATPWSAVTSFAQKSQWNVAKLSWLLFVGRDVSGECLNLIGDEAEVSFDHLAPLMMSHLKSVCRDGSCKNPIVTQRRGMPLLWWVALNTMHFLCSACENSGQCINPLPWMSV